MRNGRMQDPKPILPQTEAEGHAVRAGCMYSAMADVERFSEAPTYSDGWASSGRTLSSVKCISPAASALPSMAPVRTPLISPPTKPMCANDSGISGQATQDDLPRGWHP
jgi:hypothetical protein